MTFSFFKNLLAVLFIPLLLIGTDLGFRLPILSELDSNKWGVYLVSIAFSALIYLLILFSLITSKANDRKKLNLFLVILFSLFYTLTVVGSYGYFHYTGIMPNFFVFSFMFQEPYNSWTLFLAGLNAKAILGFIFLFSLCVYFLRQVSLLQKPKYLVATASVAGSLILLLSLFFHNNTKFQDQLYVADTNTIVFFNQNLYNAVTGDRLGSAGLQSRNEPGLAPIQRKEKPNVLLIVSESLRRKSMNLYGYQKDTTPFLSSWVKKPKDGKVTVFENAFSNASSTLISVPSILSGISPDQNIAMTHNFPLFWEYGKTLGHSTFFISSHSFRWNNFDGFFKNSGIDYLWNKETSGNPTFNDIGIDDRFTVSEFKKHVLKLKEEGSSFAGVLHFNTNHFPYFIPEGSEHFPVGQDLNAPYDNSVRHLDALMKDVILFLENERLTGHTIILFTSDHGEMIFEHGYIGHIESNHIETVSIPMMVYLPKEYQSWTNHLNQNKSKNVANIDLIPTITDLMGISKEPEIANYLNRLPGTSLLTPVQEDRTIFIANNNETSLYRVGLSFIKSDLHYILRLNSVPTKEELFRFRNDPEEKTNLWEGLADDEKKQIRGLLQDCILCRDLYSSANIYL
ncbi:sulfatase-like hydrolase/transferase [Leptospira idonii]|uniref:Sulfatase n=1 Tax=Leptospira idonii TaxID=1193500 RepID=A0A4R9M072_9LEPT|nr:sulfatase-like hydrolase/transferase [Leptospira idonii]TGN20104.1 sulfatase [Leptospira idonii]